MPRIYTSTSDPIDFCRLHFPLTEAIAEQLYGSLGDGPDGRGNCFGYDTDHPAYEGEGYHCTVCHRLLTENDDISYATARAIAEEKRGGCDVHSSGVFGCNACERAKRDRDREAETRAYDGRTS